MTTSLRLRHRRRTPLPTAGLVKLTAISKVLVLCAMGLPLRDCHSCNLLGGPMRSTRFTCRCTDLAAALGAPSLALVCTQVARHRRHHSTCCWLRRRLTCHGASAKANDPARSAKEHRICTRGIVRFWYRVAVRMESTDYYSKSEYIRI